MLVLLAALGGYAWLNRVDPSAVSDEEYHRMATEFDGGTFSMLPTVKRVAIRPLPGGFGYYVGRYLRLAVKPAWEQQAYYDDATGTIHIIGDQSILEARLPQWMRPTFTHTLRHEYGHALLAEYLEAYAPGQDANAGDFLGYTDVSSADPRNFPPPLRGVVEEYRTLPRGVYGSTYHTANFWEYMAESYARFVADERVPPVTHSFLEELARDGAATGK